MDYVAKEIVKAEFEKYGSTEDFNAVIDSIPPADVAPIKRGWWIINGSNIYTAVITCSICGFEPIFDDENPLLNYCPNCGANMEKE